MCASLGREPGKIPPTPVCLLQHRLSSRNKYFTIYYRLYQTLSSCQTGKTSSAHSSHHDAVPHRPGATVR